MRHFEAEKVILTIRSSVRYIVRGKSVPCEFNSAGWRHPSCDADAISARRRGGKQKELRKTTIPGAGRRFLRCCIVGMAVLVMKWRKGQTHMYGLDSGRPPGIHNQYSVRVVSLFFMATHQIFFDVGGRAGEGVIQWFRRRV